MGWASRYITELQAGRSVQFRPRGQSMRPIINSGDLVTVAPVGTSLDCGDVVLSQVSGHQYLHLISAIQDKRIQISNNHGHINGWTTREKVYGIVINIKKG